MKDVDSTILASLQSRFEEKRRSSLKTVNTRRKFFIIAGVLAAGAIFLFSVRGAITPPVFIFPGIILALIWGWTKQPIKKYKRRVKSEAFPEILKLLNTNIQYAEAGSMQISELKATGLLPSYDRIKTEDYMLGTWRDVPFELMELRLTRREGTGKRSRTRTVFTGLIIRFAFHKTFKGHTLLKADRGMLNALSGTFSLQRVKLEDLEFEKLFEVFSTDQVEARYLLTLSFMQRMQKLASKRRLLWEDRGAMQAAFLNDQLTLALPSTRNRFEVGDVSNPNHLEKDLSQLLQDVKDIFEIVEILKLDAETLV